MQLKNTESKNNLNLSKRLETICKSLGFESFTNIQQQAIPIILQNKNVLCQSKTGSGKTAAFILPIVQMLEQNSDYKLIVLTPTRELANQVHQFTCKVLPKEEKAVCVYGGVSYIPQKKYLMLALG